MELFKDVHGALLWNLIYDNQGTYPWKCVGGAELYAAVGTGQTVTGDNTWRDAATVGPSITLPLAGDYEFRWTLKAFSDASAASGGRASYAGLNINGTNPPDSYYLSAAWTNSLADQTMPGRVKLTGMTASHVVKLRYQQNLGTMSIANRQLWARPVRVG